MSRDPERTARWLEALIDAIEELASLNLGMDVTPAVRRESPSPDPRSIASIDVRCPSGNWRVAIASDDDGCQTLAKALLGMDEEEEDLPPEDVSDAFGEVLNILAGGLKKRLSESEGDMTLGLPEVSADRPLPAGSPGRVVAATSIGPVQAEMVIAQIDA